MLEETDIKKLRPGLTPFPGNIFVEDQPWLADHLWPLLSIDLGLLRPELAGTVVHMVRPLVPPIEGYIGESTLEFENEFAGINWFALRLTEDNRYRFLGRQGYFESCDEALAKRLREYRQKVEAYGAEIGRLVTFPGYLNGDPEAQNWIDVLGGEIWPGNWMTEKPPAAFELDERDIDDIKLTCAGKRFFHVASALQLTTLMFFEPESRTVLFTFDGS